MFHKATFILLKKLPLVLKAYLSCFLVLRCILFHGVIVIEVGTVLMFRFFFFFLMSIFGRIKSWLHSVGPTHLNVKSSWPVNSIVTEPRSPGPVEGCYTGSHSVWGIIPLLCGAGRSPCLCATLSLSIKREE